VLNETDFPPELIAVRGGVVGVEVVVALGGVFGVEVVAAFGGVVGVEGFFFVLALLVFLFMATAAFRMRFDAATVGWKKVMGTSQPTSNTCA